MNPAWVPLRTFSWLLEIHASTSVAVPAVSVSVIVHVPLAIGLGVGVVPAGGGGTGAGGSRRRLISFLCRATAGCAGHDVGAESIVWSRKPSAAAGWPGVFEVSVSVVWRAMPADVGGAIGP